VLHWLAARAGNRSAFWRVHSCFLHSGCLGAGFIAGIRLTLPRLVERLAFFPSMIVFGPTPAVSTLALLGLCLALDKQRDKVLWILPFAGLLTILTCHPDEIFLVHGGSHHPVFNCDSLRNFLSRHSSGVAVIGHGSSWVWLGSRGELTFEGCPPSLEVERLVELESSILVWYRRN
jgi:hypothetical protein